MARTRVFNPLALRSNIKSRKESDYDYEGAKEVGMKPDKTKHWGSLGKDGKVLKGRGHKTFFKTQLTEELLGNKIKFKKGRYYSETPKGKK